MKKLLIIDSTTIGLFSNLIFKGVGRNPKTGKKKGGIKVYIDYAKFEEMTRRGVIYVTKMKKNLTCETVKSAYYVNDNGQIQWREEFVVFRKEMKSKNEETGEEEKKVIKHHARIRTCARA